MEQAKKIIGWDNLFLPKKENRWLIQAFHKILLEQSYNKGIKIILANPMYTSQTCTKCNNVSPDNRKGDLFKCVNCEYEANADLDIATDNLEKVGVFGKSMKYPKSEQQNDAQATGPARKV